MSDEAGTAPARDASTRPRSGGPKISPPDAAGPPRGDPTISRLLADAEVLGRVEGSGAWALARDNHELRVYDLREKRPAERRAIEAEASIATSLGDLPGVGPVLDVWEEGGWLVVETARLGESLADHLSRSGGGREARWPAEAYAEALDSVAQTLQTVHDRGLVHLNLRPASLRLDPDSGRLVLSDFAIPTLEADDGDSRYRAPECFAGESGPSVDQYALGVIARDVFAAPAAPPLTTPIRAAMRRATAPSPRDRFATIADFGHQLQTAVRAEAPRGLSERLAGRSPAVRAALAPTAIALLATVASTTALAPSSSETPEILLLTSFLLLVLVAGSTFFGVALAGKLRGQRRRASVSLANKPLVPLLAFLVLLLPNFGSLGSAHAGAVIFRSLIIAYGGCALLAPAQPDSGLWLVTLLSHWDRRRTLRPLHRRLLAAALALCLVLVISSPALTGTIWRQYEYPTYAARGLAPLWAVWNFRVELDQGEYGRLCREVLTPSAAGDPSRCRRLARVAAAVQEADPATNRGPESFGMKGTLDSFTAQLMPAAGGIDLWDLLTPTKRLAGTIYTEGRDHRHLIVLISRERPKPRSREFRSNWLYRVVWRGGGWRIAEFRACKMGLPGSGQKPAQCAVTSSSPERSRGPL